MSTTFNQVHLPPHTIDSVRTLVSLPLLHPQAFSYGILKQHTMTGALLFGPPGTGKTLVVRALAKESGARMLIIKPSDVMDMVSYILFPSLVNLLMSMNHMVVRGGRREISSFCFLSSQKTFPLRRISRRTRRLVRCTCLGQRIRRCHCTPWRYHRVHARDGWSKDFQRL